MIKQVIWPSMAHNIDKNNDKQLQSQIFKACMQTSKLIPIN